MQFFRYLSRTLPKTIFRFQSTTASATNNIATAKEKDEDLIPESDPEKPIINLQPGGPLAEFFDAEENFGVSELRPKLRPGRPWTTEELRLKSNTDLHKLWYVLLKEKNMLLTMQHAYKIRHKMFPNPERLDRVHESMENLEEVVHERNDALLRLETGDSANPSERTVTSFAGFTYKKQAKEHYLPFEITGKKEYEVPYLDEEPYLTQKLWAEKQHLKKYHADDQRRYRERFADKDSYHHLRGSRKFFNRVEHLPK
uniref:Large ribosomal subunit protein uL29m n=1 Tax=Panagrolaimus superbus TaxID=310955 RepID=A0A914YU65_9BILA